MDKHKTIVSLVIKLALDKFGTTTVRRLAHEPVNRRIKCCRKERRLIAYNVYPFLENESFWFNVFMTMCTKCGWAIYWIDWPEDDDVTSVKQKILQDTCDEALKGLL